MSYYDCEKLDMFADLATCGNQPPHWDYRYYDPSEPDNIKMAEEFLEKELGFLSNNDIDALRDVWQVAIDDCRNTKLLVNAIKVLKDKYDKPTYQSNQGISF